MGQQRSPMTPDTTPLDAAMNAHGSLSGAPHALPAGLRCASLSGAPYALAGGSNSGRLLDRGSSSLDRTGHTLADAGGSGCTHNGSDGLSCTARGDVPLVAACGNSLLSAAHGGSSFDTVHALLGSDIDAGGDHCALDAACGGNPLHSEHADSPPEMPPMRIVVGPLVAAHGSSLLRTVRSNSLATRGLAPQHAAGAAAQPAHATSPTSTTAM